MLKEVKAERNLRFTIDDRWVLRRKLLECADDVITCQIGAGGDQSVTCTCTWLSLQVNLQITAVKGKPRSVIPFWQINET